MTASYPAMVLLLVVFIQPGLELQRGVADPHELLATFAISA